MEDTCIEQIHTRINTLIANVLSVNKETAIQAVLRKHLEANLQLGWAEEKGPFSGLLLDLPLIKLKRLSSIKEDHGNKHTLQRKVELKQKNSWFSLKERLSLGNQIRLQTLYILVGYIKERKKKETERRR